MSLGKALSTAFNIVEPTLQHAALELLEIIFSSDDPRGKIEHAKRVLTTEASFAAADATLAALLPPEPSPPAGSEPPPSSTSRLRPP